MRNRHLRKTKRNIYALVFFGIALALAVFFLRRYIPGLEKKEAKPVISGAAVVVKYFQFQKPDSLKEWEEKVFKGKVSYTLANDRGAPYVKAASDNAASALYHRLKVDAKTRMPVISWRWKAEKFPAKKLQEDLERETEDDFAARVYVIFPAMFLTNSKVLEYVWAEKLPIGTSGSSHYSKNIKLIVLESGPTKDNDWASEQRDVISDYIKAFGRHPEYNIGAIAFMTNTEHTGSQAEAKYADIKIGYDLDLSKGGDKSAH